VVVTVNTPPNMGSTGVMSATAGLIYFGFPGITWLIDSIAPHSSASASFEMLIVAPGVIFALGELTSESADSNPANNNVSPSGRALDDPTPFHLPAPDAVYHPRTEVVSVSLDPPHEVSLALDLRARLL